MHSSILFLLGIPYLAQTLQVRTNTAAVPLACSKPLACSVPKKGSFIKLSIHSSTYQKVSATACAKKKKSTPAESMGCAEDAVKTAIYDQNRGVMASDWSCALACCLCPLAESNPKLRNILSTFGWTEGDDGSEFRTPPNLDALLSALKAEGEGEVAPAPAVNPTVEVTLSLNIDYEQLSVDDKDELKGKLQGVLAGNAGVEPSAVSVTLTPGSVTVDAKIQTPDKDSALSIENSLSMKASDLEQGVLETANSIPGVQAAAIGELTVQGFELTAKIPLSGGDKNFGSPAGAPGAPSLPEPPAVWEDPPPMAPPPAAGSPAMPPAPAPADLEPVMMEPPVVPVAGGAPGSSDAAELFRRPGKAEVAAHELETYANMTAGAEDKLDHLKGQFFSKMSGSVQEGPRIQTAITDFVAAQKESLHQLEGVFEDAALA